MRWLHTAYVALCIFALSGAIAAEDAWFTQEMENLYVMQFVVHQIIASAPMKSIPASVLIPLEADLGGHLVIEGVFCLLPQGRSLSPWPSV